MSPKRFSRWLAAVLALGAIIFFVVGYRNATAAPILRNLVLTVPNYPASAAPVRIILLSDAHVHAPDTPPSRLSSIVRQINALHPDLVVAAGDYTGNSWFGSDYSPAESIAPLRALKARLGVYAVLGNHDYDAGAEEVMGALDRAGIHVLHNDAVAAGPVALGGIDGEIHRTAAAWQESRDTTYSALDALAGIKLLVAHRPDEFVFAPQSVTLVLAGHSHCGQIIVPLIGALESGSDYGMRYLCGVHREGSKVLVVTAGLGTSHVPLRFGAPADIWQITIRGPAIARPSGSDSAPASQPS